MSTATLERQARVCARDPFDLNDHEAYARWREHKLAHLPRTAEALIVEVRDPQALSHAERGALNARLHSANMAIYASARRSPDKDLPRAIGRQFGLARLDANWLADEDGISSVTVRAEPTRQDFIPYTDRPIRWHTDGYYNPPHKRIRAMVLHCVQDAQSGGENALLDHEIAYLRLRDADPAHIAALMAPDAMLIPERADALGVARAAQAGPVFTVCDDGRLHMRYTARTRSIAWKNDAATQAAVRALEALLASDDPAIWRTRLAPGMGLLCANVLHDRSGFIDDPARPRLLYRARYYDALPV